MVSLLGYHCYLVAKNRSTLESFRGPVFRHGPDKKGFHLGTYNNFIEVFGDDKKKWFLPVFSTLGDGISYPTRHSWNNFNGNYNSIDTTDSTPASGYILNCRPFNHIELALIEFFFFFRNSPDHCVEVKVEARREPTPKFNNNGNGNNPNPPEGQGPNGTPLVYF